MKVAGNIRKMASEMRFPVAYVLPFGDKTVAMNELLGKHLSLNFDGQINCIACGRKTNKSFNQGYCFPCMRSLAECDMCIVKPEQCHFDQGTCRDAQWGLSHCMQDHFVYLANTSGLKVGITRHTQIPTRWIDQGANQALPVWRANSRYISGLVEVIIKRHMADRTDWRKMLKGDAETIDLNAKRDEIIAICAQEIATITKTVPGSKIETLTDQDIVTIKYPVNDYPDKVRALNFDKTSQITGQLMGIKGQYLILDQGVLNMRKFAGYHIELTIN